MIKTIYFSAYYVALGTLGGIEDYTGEYYTSEEYDLPVDMLVTGLNTTEIAAAHRLNVAVTPKYRNYIMEKVRQHLGLEYYDTSRDAEINDMAHNDIFYHCLEWEGIIGYDLTIRGWVVDIYGVTLS